MPALGFILVGAVVGVAAWLLPASLRSVSPSLLRAAGNYTPSAAAFGEQLVDAEKIGPAAQALAAARTLRDPRADALASDLDRLTARQPALAAWGGWDPFLDPILHLRAGSGHPASTPVLDLFLPEQARAALHAAMDDSGSLAVQDLLRVGAVPGTGRFVPAGRPGGQPLDATLLLAAALYQGGHLTAPFQRQLRDLAGAAQARKALGELEPVLLNLLTLGRRFDWVQLSELLARTDNVATLDEFAHLARVAPAQAPLFYTAALMAGSADRTAEYLAHYGAAGAADLRQALADGEGAVQQLLRRQLPVNPRAGPALSLAGALVLAHPEFMLGLKYLGYLVAFFLVLRGLDRLVVSPGLDFRGSGPRLRTGLAAVILAGLLVAVTEPYLLKAAPTADFRLRLPVLLASPAPPAHPPIVPSQPPWIPPPSYRSACSSPSRSSLPDLPAQDRGHRRPGDLAALEAPPHGK